MTGPVTVVSKWSQRSLNLQEEKVREFTSEEHSQLPTSQGPMARSQARKQAAGDQSSLSSPLAFEDLQVQ